jgi:hypothetical protein
MSAGRLIHWTEVENATTSQPTSLGQLGEEYAAAWLQQQTWVAQGSMRWLNGDGDQYADHDFECVPMVEPRHLHVEVKTWWRRSVAKMSSRQLQRLLAPSDDYILLIIRDAHNMFGVRSTSASAPSHLHNQHHG